MNVNKDKKIKVNFDESVKHRRSSLKVNLSCGSNLTDSGNESLKQTDIEYHDGTWLGNNKPGCSNAKQTSVNHRPISYDIPSKTANVSLEKISHNDAILNRHCEKLKYAILTKTNQMFDKQNQLSLKTCTVLNAKDDRSSTALNNNVTCITEKNVNEVESKNTGTNLHQSINSTPKDKYRPKSMKNQRKQNRLKKRLLFLAKEPSNDKSFISSQNQSLSASNTLVREDTSMATPIACSTMIDGNNKISVTDDEIHFQARNSLSLVSNMPAGNSTTSMEITDVCGGFILYDKPQSSVKCLAKDASKCCLRNSASDKCASGSLEQTLLQINPNDEKLLYETSNKFIKATTVNKDIEQNTDMQWNNPSIETDSANTLQTSLNVNTSIDMVNKSMDKCTQKHERKTCKNFKSRYKEGIRVAGVEEAQESINTVCTSLQMNTSLNTLSTSQENDCRNITSELNNEKHKEKKKINSITVSNWNRLVVDQIYSNEQSYIEATPYPMYRSVMLKSQLKQNAIACSLQSNNQFNGSELKYSTDIHVEAKSRFPEQDTPGVSINVCGQNQEQTIILNHSCCERSNMKSQTSVPIEEVVNENKSKEDINIKKIDKKRSKKKLMPLHECSQVSFSPMEKQYSPPRCLIFKKQVKRKNKCNKMNTSNVQRNEREEKKTKKVVSKKIVIKKIVNEDILRNLEENRENLNKTRVDVHGSNGNSSNDFQSLKRPSTTQFTRKKGRRINIVTTGLSNEDKGIVKSVVKTLGLAKLESNVTKRTTHVVTTGVRTINLLHGIIRGCWLVGLEWVLKSLENNAWLSPEEYEMAHFSKAVLENRKDRQLFGSSYVPELFTACGYIYIEKNTTPPYSVLKDLIKAAGGCITENLDIAKVVIGTEGIKETWVLDCITSGELQPYNQYRR
nr:uncharacterized protein LOC117606218 isoform X1 [Osmia lignaria]